MKKVEVDNSSNIKSFGYEEKTSTLKVWFLNDSIYEYYDVPESIFGEMNRAASKGGYLARHVKGVYRYSRV